MMNYTLGSTVKDRRKRIGKITYVFVPGADRDIVDVVLVKFNGYKTEEWTKLKDLTVIDRKSNVEYTKF